MRTQARWGEVLHAEPEFLDLEKQILSGAIKSYRDIPAHAFSMQGWEMIESERILKMAFPFLREQVARARETMPAIYGENLRSVDLSSLKSMDDWYKVPLLRKDDDPESTQRGFRGEVNKDPLVMKPKDLRAPVLPFGSGGTQGKWTPTFLTLDDRARESHGLRRMLRLWGFDVGDTVLSTYNPTHKAAQYFQEALLLSGMNVVMRRPEEDSKAVLENMKDYKVVGLLTVQQPIEHITNQAKSGGINLHSLVETSLENAQYRGVLVPDDSGRKQIQIVVLIGFDVVPYAFELQKEHLRGTPLVQGLGSSEAAPQGACTNEAVTPTALCHNNNSHLLQGPHLVEIVKRDGDRWIPVKKGEEGWIVYTSWARDGTLWIRYVAGDVGTLMLNEGECTCGLKSPVVTGVSRKNKQERQQLLVTGCASG
jgi:phenylacetate-CoA ligase